MKSVRTTKAKTEIQKLIVSSSVALSHSEIQKELNNLCDRVTIYRVLERLMKERVIHKIINIDGVVKYAACQSCSEKHSHNHVHFNCQNCKTVICMYDVEPLITMPRNYKISDMNMTLSGLCPSCS
jgi:Fur family transcriptional regulator, ferric uptake regulator